MFRISTILLLLVYTTTCVYAQDNGVRVQYRQILDLVVGFPNKNPIGISTMLIANNKHSVYVFDKLKKGETYKSGRPSEEELNKMKQDGVFNININPYADSIGQALYKNFETSLLLERKFYSPFPRDKGDPKIYEEPLPQLPWKLHEEQKNIGKFACQKATTYFRGRNYTAWFASEIPINAGPWKFHGLAGLILEVYDDTNRVKFLFESIEYPIKSPIAPPPVESGERITFEQYKYYETNKGREQMTEKRSKAREALMQSRNATVQVSYVEREFVEKEFEKN